MRKRNKIHIHYLICEECGSEFPIPRYKRFARESGHLKDLYCPVCRKETKHEETQEKYLAK